MKMGWGYPARTWLCRRDEHPVEGLQSRLQLKCSLMQFCSLIWVLIKLIRLQYRIMLKSLLTINMLQKKDQNFIRYGIDTEFSCGSFFIFFYFFDIMNIFIYNILIYHIYIVHIYTYIIYTYQIYTYHIYTYHVPISYTYIIYIYHILSYHIMIYGPKIFKKYFFFKVVRPSSGHHQLS